MLGGLNVNIQLFKQFVGFAVHRFPVDKTGTPRLAANEQVFGHREVRAQCDLLIHGADAQSLCLLRRMDRDRVTIQQDLALVHFVDAGQHLDQGGFARAVFSHQGVYFAAVQGKAGVL
ncbi:hypothetical protein SDC9_180619 [bioreactor metagenome]|uniref:Uncharacterized protein n=1 Tax=bioreactor metagenome TaxID=1076179 RepID=A0A645H3S6_9ZZZZ